jgi:hypothetical protein
MSTFGGYINTISWWIFILAVLLKEKKKNLLFFSLLFLNFIYFFIDFEHITVNLLFYHEIIDTYDRFANYGLYMT